MGNRERFLVVVAFVLLLGAVPGGSASATPGAKRGSPVLAFSPSPLDFGSVRTGQSGSQTFTLTNSGGSASGALAVALSGSSAFAITSDTCSKTSLGPRKSCTVVVRFAPTSFGTVASALTATGKKAGAVATDSLSGRTGLGGGEPPTPHLYWSNFRAGTIVEADLNGDNPQTIASGQDGPQGLAVDSNHLYWANTLGRTIVEANLDGTNPQTIATNQDALGVAVSSTNLYWDAVNWIVRTDLNGGNQQTIVPNPNLPGSIGPVAVDSSHLYWVNFGGQGIAEANLDGTNAHMIATNQIAPGGVAVDSTHSHLYWTASGNEILSDGTVVEADLDGGNAQTIASNQSFPYGVATDGTHVYWANLTGGTIVEADLDGGNPQTIATGQDDPAGVAVGP
jgi:hypothetical protein